MSDGVIKLTAYLNQTRRQAELAIDVLNQKISELIKDNEELNNTLNNVFEERDHFKSIADKLKLENTKKYKFQERDDWKSLVESINKDRSRIQEENVALERSLQAEREKSTLLMAEVESLSNTVSKLSNEVNELRNLLNDENLRQLSQNGFTHENGFTHTQRDGKEIIFEGDTSSGLLHLLQTPIKENTLSVPVDMTPRSSANAMQIELEKTNRILELERKITQGEIQTQSEQIKQLKRQLSEALASSNSRSFSDLTTLLAAGDSMNDRSTNGHDSSHSIDSHTPRSEGGWFNFFFTGSTSARRNSVIANAEVMSV